MEPTRTYVIATELLMDDSFPSVPRRTRSKHEWSMYFKPDQYWDDHPEMTIEN